jgi:hypothetical protein
MSAMSATLAKLCAIRLTSVTAQLLTLWQMHPLKRDRRLHNRSDPCCRVQGLDDQQQLATAGVQHSVTHEPQLQQWPPPLPPSPQEHAGPVVQGGHLASGDAKQLLGLHRHQAAMAMQVRLALRTRHGVELQVVLQHVTARLHRQSKTVRQSC